MVHSQQYGQTKTRFYYIKYHCCCFLICSSISFFKSSSSEVDKSVSLKLIFNGKEVIVDEEHPYANLGRSEDNEIPVNHDLVSRVHTRVELYKEKFRLQDKSTNGTYVRPASGQPVFVRRDYLTLTGSGMFGLGQDVTANSPYAIRYIVMKNKSDK